MRSTRRQLVDLGVKCITDEDPINFCVLQEELFDNYPLQEYKTCGLSVIVLHHSFPFFFFQGMSNLE